MINMKIQNVYVFIEFSKSNHFESDPFDKAIIFTHKKAFLTCFHFKFISSVISIAHCYVSF